MLRRLIDRMREPSSLAGLSALALLAGQGADTAQAWAQLVAAVLGVAAVLVPENDR